MSKKETWKIRVQGYGTFDFDGTEVEAEAMRQHKGRWEGGVAIMWRADLSTELDRLRAEQARPWDAGKGMPQKLAAKIRAAKAARTL